MGSPLTYKLNENIELGKVVLNVRDLFNMLTFYQDKVGLDVLESSDTHAILGIAKDNRELVELRTSSSQPSTSPKTGLYHLALLLPSRRDFANVLFDLITQKNVDLQGASDHGYSEALYFADPEGNGIEIYWDKPKSEWTILDDGTIPGVTEPLDGNGVLAEKDTDTPGTLPQGTVMGHVHLMVSNVAKSKEFYEDVIGLDTKFEAGPYALFMAAGEYHHHVAMNVWSTREAGPNSQGDLGLNYYTIKLTSEEEFNQVKEQVANLAEIKEDKDQSFKVTDPNGITVKFTYA